MDPKKKNQIKIVIVGAGGFGKEVLSTLHDCNKKKKRYNMIGFIDDNKSLEGKLIDDVPILGGISWLSKKAARDVRAVVTIGDGKIRQRVVKKLKENHVNFITIIHPSVALSKFVEIGEGTIIQAGSIVMPDTKIGNHVHINMDCSVAHDCTLEDFVTLTPGVHINGNNIIKTGAYLGTGTTTKDMLTIGRWSIIGAGTVLIKNVQEYSMYVGVPGRLKKKIKSIKDRPSL